MRWLSLASVWLFILVGSGGCSKGSSEPSDLRPGWWVDQNPSGVSFSVKDEGGVLTGQMWLKNLDTDSYTYGGDLQGSRQGSQVRWTAGIATVDGVVTASSITGKITYGAWGGEPETTEDVILVEAQP